MNRLILTVDDAADLLAAGAYGAGALLRWEYCATYGGTYVEGGTVALVTAVQVYEVWHDAVDTTWYRSRISNAAASKVSAYSDPFQAADISGLYVTLAEFKRYIKVPATADSAEDPIREMAIMAASRSIDTATHRTFTASAAATARYYTAPRERSHRLRLAIDDLVDATALSVAFDMDDDDTYETAVTDYRLYPLNAAADGKPWTHLVFGPTVSIPYAEGAIKVSATWGWTTIPASIKTATLIQASRYYKRRDSVFGVAGSPEMGNELRLLPKLDPDVEVMVGDFRRFYPGVA
jgi:hypothetical protein